MDAPTWQQQMQQFQHDRERSHVPQAWQVPLKGEAQERMMRVRCRRLTAEICPR